MIFWCKVHPFSDFVLLALALAFLRGSSPTFALVDNPGTLTFLTLPHFQPTPKYTPKFQVLFSGVLNNYYHPLSPPEHLFWSVFLCSSSHEHTQKTLTVSSVLSSLKISSLFISSNCSWSKALRYHPFLDHQPYLDTTSNPSTPV